MQGLGNGIILQLHVCDFFSCANTMDQVDVPIGNFI